MERRNRSSYAKTRPVLRTDSELEDKTGTMRAKIGHGSKDSMEMMGEDTQTGLEHDLTSNKTTTRTQTQHDGL